MENGLFAATDASSEVRFIGDEAGADKYAEENGGFVEAVSVSQAARVTSAWPKRITAEEMTA